MYWRSTIKAMDGYLSSILSKYTKYENISNKQTIFHASGDFCCRLFITIANSFDPDQDKQNVSPR